MLEQKNLHGYQRDIGNAIVLRKNLFIIAEMGLGKTAPTLYAINYLQQIQNYGAALVFAPKRVVYNTWPSEIQKWQELQHLDYHIIHGKGKITPLPTKNLHLINYESLPFLINANLYKNFDILVIDESSFVKNHKTKRFKMFKRIIPYFKKIILLTGTPSPSKNLIELFSQVYLLDQGIRLGKYITYFLKKYYTLSTYGYYSYDLRPGSREQITNKIKDLCMTLQAKDYIKLPGIIKTTITVDMPTEAKKIYKTTEKKFLIDIQNDRINIANATVKISKLKQIAAGGIYNNDKKYLILHKTKIETLQEISGNFDSNVLCVYQFNFEKELILSAFPDAKILGGEPTEKENNELINQWNNKKIKLLCCHPKAGGHGLNLQDGGNVIVWLSPDWSLEATMQLNARLYRQGQKKKVYVYTIACKNSIDIAIIKNLGSKDQSQKSLINALKNYASEKKVAA